MAQTKGYQVQDINGLVLPDGSHIAAKIYHTQFGDDRADMQGKSVLRIRPRSEEKLPAIEAALKAKGVDAHKSSYTPEIHVMVDGDLEALKRHIACLDDIIRNPALPLGDKGIAALDWDYHHKGHEKTSFELSFGSLPPEHQREIRERFGLSDSSKHVAFDRDRDGRCSNHTSGVSAFVTERLMPALVARALDFKPTGSEFSCSVEGNDLESYQHVFQLASKLPGVSASRDHGGLIESVRVGRVVGAESSLHTLLSAPPAADVAPGSSELPGSALKR